MVSGEYAVLLGAPALVVSAQYRVQATWSVVASAAPTPEVKATRALAEERWGAVEAELCLDDHALRLQDQKIGLGSSAAKAVTSAAAVCAAAGKEICASRDEIFELALLGHRSVAPNGSGADIASATYGGWIAYRTGENFPTVEVMHPPADLSWSVIWTGAAATTHDLVQAVLAARRDKASVINPLLARIADGSATCIAALQNDDSHAFMQSFAEQYGALEELGKQSSAPIVSAEIETLASLAQAHHGVAKQSGAGGGDVVLAVFQSEAAKDDFEKTCRGKGFFPLKMAIGGEGVRSENM